MPFPDLSDISENEDDTANDAFVWGTNVSIARVCKRARRFFTRFTEPGADEPKYMTIIRQARSTCRCRTHSGAHILLYTTMRTYHALGLFPLTVVWNCSAGGRGYGGDEPGLRGPGRV